VTLALATVISRWTFTPLDDRVVPETLGQVPMQHLPMRPPRAVLGLLTGAVDLERAEYLGLSATGATGLLARLRPAVSDPAPAQGEARSEPRRA
jgi:hypothetical protein